MTSPTNLTSPITVNITELTTTPTTDPKNGLEAMPGDLPAASAYTYAVEFGVQGALGVEVDFNQPVISYTENFVNIPLAPSTQPAVQPVPAGYYDRTKAVWVAAPSGMVVNIVGISGNMVLLNIDGAKDINGNLSPTSDTALTNAGITSGERITLLGIYGSTSQSFWRMPIPHFSTVDYNFCHQGSGTPPNLSGPLGPGLGGGAPNAGGGGGPGGPGPDDGCYTKGSIIECLGQSLGERIPVTGTPYTLSYRTDRSFGYKSGRTITIPVTASLPSPVPDEIAVFVIVAGRRFSSQDPNSTLKVPTPYAANQAVTFTFDGLDAYGRRLQGVQRATVYVAYAYTSSTYQPTATFGDSNVSGATFTSAPQTRLADVTYQQWMIGVGTYTAIDQGLGGWDFDVHHFYDPMTNILYFGDGRRRTGAQTPKIVTWAAGTGSTVPTTDGVAITHATPAPHSAVAAPDGLIYFVDGSSQVRRLLNGNLTHVAGGGTGAIVNGATATNIPLTSTDSIALGPDGSLYIADTNYFGIVKVANPSQPNATITIIAGGNGSGDTGDGGSALAAKFISPSGIAVATDGTVYVADSNANRVRRIATSGYIYPYAGNGTTATPAADNMPAATGQLALPADLAVGPDNTLYIMDSGDKRIRHVTTAGIITTVVGGGTGTTDGIQAIASDIGTPSAMTVGPDGAIYIGQGYTVRRVASDGRIVTIAGQLNAMGADWKGDNGPATAALFGTIHGIAIGPQANPSQDQVLYAADYNENVIRKVAYSLASTVNILSDDGKEIYQFDLITGRHAQTLNALVGAIHYKFQYDGNGLLSSIADFTSGPAATGNVTTIDHTANTIRNYYNQTTQLGFNGGYLTSITDPAGATVSFNYTPDGLMTGLVDAKNNEHKFEYESNGLLVRDADPAGGVKTPARTIPSPDPITNPTGTNYSVAVTTFAGVKTTYQIQNYTNGSQTRTTTTSSSGTPQITLTSTHTKSPGTITCSPSSLTGTECSTSVDGTIESDTYGPDPRFYMNGKILVSRARTTPVNNTVFSEARSRTVTLSNPSDPTSLTQQTENVTFNGGATGFTDTFTRSNPPLTATLVTPLNKHLVRAYDSRGRLQSVTLGNLAPIVYGYDDTVTGRLNSITQGGVRNITLAYNASGQLSRVTGPAPFTYHSDLPSYDSDGRVKQITLPDGTSTIALAYDANGNLTSLTPPGRPAHAFNYTALDLAADYVPPDVSIGTTLTRYGYNSDRLLSNVTLPDGTTMNYLYDGVDRLSTTTYSRGVRQTNYNPTNGQLASVITPDGVELDYTFDGKLPTKYSWTGPMHGSVTLAYDNNWRVDSETITDVSQSANAVLSVYDADGLLSCAGATSPSTCTGAVLTLTRDSATGMLTGSTTTVGSTTVTDTRTLDSLAFAELSRYQAGTTGTNNLVDIQYQPTINTTTYPRDASGRLTAKLETIITAGNTYTTYYYTYLYDPDGRVTDVFLNSPTVHNHYDYGPNGVRSGYTPAGGTSIPLTYDNQDRLIQFGTTGVTGTKTYTYGPNGERRSVTVTGGTNAGTTLYNYDQFGNLLSVVRPAAPAITYTIDGQNRRIGKQVGGTPVMGLLYDSQLRAVAQLDGNSHLVSQFVYATDTNVPDYMIQGTTIYRILKDQLGSPRIVWNLTSNVLAQRLDYDEFGNETLVYGIATLHPFGFAGGLYDPDTLLVRFGARDYDPSVGQWLAKDPIDFRGGAPNLYSYSSNDPINRSDPSGLDPTTAEMCIDEANSWPPQLRWIPYAAAAVVAILTMARVQCDAQCNVQDIGAGDCPPRVNGWGTGPNEDLACKAAKRDATQSTPLGCYPRHCKCDCN